MPAANPKPELYIREGFPDFLDLPWEHSISSWPGKCQQLEEVPRGLSRHPVVFVNYAGTLYAIKELPAKSAQAEFQNLRQMEDLHLPAILAVGYGKFQPMDRSLGTPGVLITRYLDFSLPYRVVFMGSGLARYREHLLDAMAGLLVQLHLAGIFWGDCSLSNTLFRRDAGMLQAYLVDAETAEIHPPRLSPTLRYHDLQIMEENLDREVNELLAAGSISSPQNFSLNDTSRYIHNRYQQVWEEITREEVVNLEERYRIQERIRTLNKLGFSVGGVELHPTDTGEKLRLRVMVTDRLFHQNQLLDLTGLQAEEHQATQIMNEIQEVKAGLTLANDRETSLNVAAYHWYEQIYLPVIQQIKPLMEDKNSKRLGSIELYCQILEHKWFLSEKARQDVGHQAAAEDYLHSFPNIHRDLSEP